MTLQFQNLGIWLNWKDPYMTLRDEYNRSSLGGRLKKLMRKTLLEKGLRSLTGAPGAETAIADSEVEVFGSF